MDVKVEADHAAAFDFAKRTFGPVYAAFASAGIPFGATPPHEITSESPLPWEPGGVLNFGSALGPRVESQL